MVLQCNRAWQLNVSKATSGQQHNLESSIKPILLYGCESWHESNSNMNMSPASLAFLRRGVQKGQKQEHHHQNKGERGQWWLCHVFPTAADHKPKVAARRAPPGNRKPGTPKDSLAPSCDEYARMNLTWGEAHAAADREQPRQKGLNKDVQKYWLLLT